MTVQSCNICREPLNSTSGFSLARGVVLPVYRLCDHCGASLEPAMRKLEALATVQRRLGLDRVIAA